MHYRYRLLLLSSIAALSACTLGPDYTKEPVNISNEWFTPDAADKITDKTGEIKTDWWNIFEDPQLSALIEKTAGHNLDIKIATANIRQARALRRVEASGYFPKIDAGAAMQRQGLSEHGATPITAGLTNENRDYYDGVFDASWEIDLFGSTNRSVEAAQARLEAAFEERNDILLSVLAETARSYADLRGTQRRISIMKKNIDLQQKTLDIVHQRYKAGEANEFDLVRSKAQLDVTQAKLPNLNARERSAAQRLAVLTGKEPQALLDELLKQKPLPAPPDIVPVGLRSDILRRRPDVRYAERLLAAQNADIGAAKAELFPSFFLTGSIGQESLSFGELFTSAASAWALGPMIKWPVFRAGEIRAKITSEKAQADAAAYIYEKTILTALEETQNALVRYGEELETRKRLEQATFSNKKALYLAQQRYEQGEDDILSVIDAERELAQVEDDLVQSETRVLTNLISLYKALGGGWEIWQEKDN